MNTKITLAEALNRASARLRKKNASLGGIVAKGGEDCSQL
jgi:hypothetical protein